MKIVIDIDDEDYKRIQGISDVFNSLTSRAYSAIRNGAPLPDTNVGDLISRQAVIDTIETDCSWDIFNEWGSRTPTGECIIEAIKRVPSVEPERKPGKWINVDGSTNSADCSCCGNRGRAWMNYCYLCGAKMEEDV